MGITAFALGLAINNCAFRIPGERQEEVLKKEAEHVGICLGLKGSPARLRAAIRDDFWRNEKNAACFGKFMIGR
jgi:hypothetical protein